MVNRSICVVTPTFEGELETVHCGGPGRFFLILRLKLSLLKHPVIKKILPFAVLRIEYRPRTPLQQR
jgi:hypothetical protein